MKQRLPNDDYILIIKVDRTPSGELNDILTFPQNRSVIEIKYIPSLISEVAIAIIKQQFGRRAIILTKRGNNLQPVTKPHRS